MLIKRYIINWFDIIFKISYLDHSTASHVEINPSNEQDRVKIKVRVPGDRYNMNKNPHGIVAIFNQE